MTKANRPQFLSDFEGQPQVTAKLAVAVAGARSRNEPLDHVIFHGPAGLGKTTLSLILANEMQSRCVSLVAPAITSIDQLTRILVSLRYKDVLFIDEIHRLNVEIEEYLYSAIEDFVVIFPDRAGPLPIHLAPFTLAAGTTKAGSITKPLRQRFGIECALDFYSDESLARIIARDCQSLGLRFDPEALGILASKGRGTPRIAKTLLRRARDFTNGVLTVDCANQTLASEGIDSEGFNDLDRLYLSCLSNTMNGGPAGVKAIASSIDRDVTTLEENVEPFLIRKGMIVRTPRGRKIVKMSQPEPQYL